MTNRVLPALVLLACAVLLTSSANAQVIVSSHTNIDNQRRIVPICQTLMQDTTTKALYPNASVVCTVNQNGAIQTLPECFGNPSNPNAVCSVATATVVEGGNYQTTGRHGLVMQLAPDGCIQNGVLFNCLTDPLGYGLPLGFPVPPSRQFTDGGQVVPAGVQSFWSLVPNNDVLIGTTAEPLFEPPRSFPSYRMSKPKMS